MLRSWFSEHVSRLTSEAVAGVAVPVVAAVAVDRTGVGAAGVGHAAARLHVHLPRLGHRQSPAHTQTLQVNTQVHVHIHRILGATLTSRQQMIVAHKSQINLKFLAGSQVWCFFLIREMFKINERGNHLLFCMLQDW